MENLKAEYNEYLELSNIREQLNNQIKDLIGKNDEESIEKLNKLGNEIGKVDSELSRFDMNLFNKIDSYFSLLKEIEKLNEEIELIEKWSKKITHVNDRSEVISAEGRKKLIDKEYSEKYQDLSNKKKELRKKLLEIYHILEKISTIKKNIEKATPKIEPAPANINDVYGYEELSLDDKIKETKERIERIFKTATLPNMGKKILVTYEGQKREIPEIYKGRYYSTIAELNTLLNKKKAAEKIETPPNEIKINEDDLDNIDLNLYNLNQIVEKNKIVLQPVEVSFSKIPNLSLRKSYVTIKSKIDVEKIKKIVSIYNIDKKMELFYRKVEVKLLDKGIKIKTNGVKIARGVISKYNTSKAFVRSTSKKVSDYISNKYSNFREYVNKKRGIINNIKSGEKLKSSMENVYGENKEKYLDYRIINRTVNFNKNMCQKINETKGNITNVSKKIIDKLKEPFDKLKESMRNDVQRKELGSEIQRIKQEKLLKKEELKRIKIKSDSGYVAMGTLVVVGIIALSTIIFTIIQNFLG